MAVSDEHGQAPNPRFHQRRLEGRSADELIGLIRGVLADGAVNQAEAEFLEHWMRANANYLQTWPFDQLYTRLVAMLEDGILDHDEERELLDALSSVANPVIREDGSAAPNESLCDDPPPPTIELSGCRVCFTGKFAADTRRNIEKRAIRAGADVKTAVSGKLDFLVIGACGSRDWIMSAHGRKLEKAAVLKREGHQLHVVAERVFVRHLDVQAPSI